LEEIAELATGERTASAVAATLRELLESKLYFSRSGDRWTPRSRSSVDEAIGQRAIEKRRAGERARFIARAREAVAGRAAVVRTGEDEETRLLGAFEETAISGAGGGAARETLEALAAIGAAGENPEEAAFRALHAMGLWEEDENVFVRRFGLRIAFPNGAE